MSVTSGFFNSLNGDRRYNSEQMSKLFNGIINDGVFMNIGTMFGVLAATGNSVTVGIGKCWFDSSWVENDSILPLDADQSEVLLDRIDAVVVEVNHSVDVRDGFIKIIKGIPGSVPERPIMEDSEYIKQRPFAFILRPAGSTSINQINITNVVGTSQCPFITGILETADIDNLVIQWKSKWNIWTDEQKISFSDWTNTLKNILDGDVATSLAEQIYRTNHVTLTTLYANSWTGTSAPWTQIVLIPGINDDTEATVVSALEEDAPLNIQKAYNKAFNIILSGTGKITKEINGAIFKVYKKPATDITIGLKGINGSNFSQNTNILLDSEAKVIFI